MCLDIDFDDWVALGPATWRTARKPHKCDECRRVIEPGERYYHYAGKNVEWDQFLDVHMCAHCRATIVLGSALTGCPRAWYWEQIHSLEADEGGFVGDILVNHDLRPAHRYRMLRTVCGRRRSWRRKDGTLLPVPMTAAELEAVLT